MTQETKIQVDLKIIMPAVLLVIETIVVSALLAWGYQLNRWVCAFFILLGIFLLYQIVRQVIAQWQIIQAITRIKVADKMAADGRPYEAVGLWKSLLFKLPKQYFLSVLSKMRRTYQNLEMDQAVQQVNSIHSESMAFFTWIKKVDRPTKQDQEEWQDRAFKLRKLIQALPVEPGQEFSNSNSKN